jgi:homoserine dehydrogenase
MPLVKVAIVGMGNVGSGVARLLLEHRDRLARHAGRQLVLEKAIVRDLNKERGVSLPAGVLSTDLRQVTDNPEIKVVAHLIGGVEPARSIMLRLLESGKDIVTANKALLAEHGQEVFDRARELGRAIAFDAAVAGGIPIITNIGQCLSANQITSLRGILNGTTNFIISRMEEHGSSYAEAVREAQRLGFAESDPTLDVDGSDAAQKLAILAHLAFGARVHWTEIPRVGINTLDPADLRYARELGFRIKLLASAQLTDDGLELGVQPTLVRIGSPLAEVREVYNAINIVGDAVGRVFFQGLGAGQMPTASAVVADLVEMAVGRAQITFRTLDLWSSAAPRVLLADHTKVPGRNYFRFTIVDRPGVLAEIAGVLGRNNISIASVIQHEPQSNEEGEVVPLVIMTHTATDGAVQQALAEIDRLPAIRQPSVRMRVLD